MENELLDILTRIGLTKNDSIVYLSLLKLGKSYVGGIIKGSDLHSSRVYESLNTLISLGLVSYVLESNRKMYRAEDPRKITKIIDEMKNRAAKVMPSMLSEWNESREEQKAAIYEGYGGLRSLFDRILRDLKPGEEHLVFSAVKEPENFVAYFTHWNKERIKKKIKMRIAFSEEAKSQITQTTQNALVKYKEIPREFATPTTINVFKNNVALVLWTNNPIAFVIESESVADSFRKYFEFLWKYNFKKV